MTVNLDPSSHIFDQDSGRFINAKHQRIAEIINDFDPSLFLMWIPPEHRTNNPLEQPYAVGQMRDNLPEPYIIMLVSEEELDHRLIGKLFRARQLAEGRPGSLEKCIEDANRLVEMKKEAERLEDAEIAADKAKFLWRTPLHSPTMDGKRFQL